MTKCVAHTALRPSRPHGSSAQCGRRKARLHGKNKGSLPGLPPFVSLMTPVKEEKVA